MASLAWIVAAFVLLFALAALWRYGKNISICQGRRKRVKSWILERKILFEWLGVAVRIMFYNCQIIAKYTELQDVDWPFPFNAYMAIMNGIANVLTIKHQAGYICFTQHHMPDTALLGVINFLAS